MKNAMQLKAIVKNIASEKHISEQLVLQNFILERFLERVSLSPYRNKFVLKGGFLIASIVGLDSRATMDIDATIKGYPVTAETVRRMVEDIASVSLPDGITFTYQRCREIREGDEYGGYRVVLTANYPPLSVPFKLDITTGDKITPGEIEFSYKLMLEERSIKVMAYNLATIMAEKLETVITRGDQNTRMRDYYDIYILHEIQGNNIHIVELQQALEATTKKRGSSGVLKQYRSIMANVKNSEQMHSQWNRYRKEFEYAAEIEFAAVCTIVDQVLDEALSGLG